MAKIKGLFKSQGEDVAVEASEISVASATIQSNSFGILAVPDASYTPTIAVTNTSLPIADVLGTANGSISVAFTPTTAISSVTLTAIALSGTGKSLFGTITVTPSLPVIMTSATTVTFSFPYSSNSFTGTYAGTVTDSFKVSAKFMNASILSGSTDTIAVNLSTNYVVLSSVTATWAYNTLAEHSRLYVNGEI